MEYLDTGQFERIQAGGTTFSTGPLGLASSTDAAVLSTNYVRDSNAGLVARRDLLGTQYYLFDRLGSVVALTDASGNAVNSYVYDPYGNHLSGTTEAVANPWQFAGGFKDSFSGYYKFGTRYYDPTIGRWTQPDPSGFEANSYAYAAGNPVNFVDPTGMVSWGQAWDWFKKHADTSVGGCYLRCFFIGQQGGNFYYQTGEGCCFSGTSVGISDREYQQRSCDAIMIGASSGPHGISGEIGVRGTPGNPRRLSDVTGSYSFGAPGGGVGFVHTSDLWVPDGACRR